MVPEQSTRKQNCRHTEVNFNTCTFSTFQQNGAFWLTFAHFYLFIPSIRYYIFATLHVCGKRCHQIRYAHEKLNIYHATESCKTIKKTNERMEERTRTKTNGRILLQIAYIEGKPNVRVNTKTSEREMKRGANSCDASAFVWVGNHQKLVVCLRASLLYTTQWCCALENGNRIHILHNIHLFFTQFHRLSPSLFRSFHNHLPVRLFALTFLSHFFSLSLCSSILQRRRTFHMRKNPSNFTSCLFTTSVSDSPSITSNLPFYG